MISKKITIIFYLCTLVFCSYSQTDKYKSYNYHSPLDTTLLLSGNFAEIRSNHFHGGLDIKTGGKEGRNIYAIEDGYVARIKIATGGYGKCLYIKHPDGHTSVYAHLQKFNETIQKYVSDKQYAKRTFTIELFPQAGDLVVKRGEVIALSGNTGGSGGPHLHFEIRDQNQVPINPLLFNFDIKDDIPPSITMLGIYPKDVNSYVNNKTESIILKPTNGKDGYYISNYKDIVLSGEVGFGVSVTDYLNNTSNRCGIYSIELKIDGVTHFMHDLDQVSFAETRYINSLVDFEKWKKASLKIQKCFIDPGNYLNTYSNVINKGYYKVKDTLKHTVEIIVKDSYANTSVLKFDFTGKIEKSTINPPINYDFKYDEYNSFQNEYVVLAMPEGALYSDINFEFSIDSSVTKYASPIYNIHNKYVPLHKRITLSINAESIPKNLRSKAFIAEIDNGKPYYNRGNYSNGFITIKTKYLGKYALAIDTKKPKVEPKNFVPNQNISGLNKLVYTIKDNFSGIKSYYGTIDGKWVLMEYEHKKNELTYYFDNHLPTKPGKHEIQIIVRDKVGNKTVNNIPFSL